jgi:formate-dependent phosphoribosylglycinamide formyltransferase (GAR transformylase)
MKIDKINKVIEMLNRDELALVKGGEERDYVIVVIDGVEVRIYV